MLSNADIKILKFLKKKPGSSIKDIEKNLSGVNCIQTRIYNLGLQLLVAERVIPAPEKIVGYHTGTYELTNQGMIYLDSQRRTFTDNLKRYAAYIISALLGAATILAYIDPNAEIYMCAKNILIETISKLIK